MRTELQTRGAIAPDDHTFQTLNHRSDITGADRAWAVRYQPGNVVQYTTGSKELGIERGSSAAVLSTNARENTVTVQKRDGETVTYNPQRLRGVNVFEIAQREFATGDRIQFTAPDKGIGIVRRELGIITKLSYDEITVKLDGKEGRTVAFNPKEFRSFDHGYTVTSHSAQGLTTERVLINIDADGPRALINSRLAYVAVSRAAHEAQIYTNDARGLAASLSSCGYSRVVSRNVPNYYEVFSNYVYHNPFGSSHAFNYTFGQPCEDIATGKVVIPASTTGDGSSNDGSGYTLVNSGSQVRTVSGTLITPPYSQSGSGTQSDANGNHITYDGSGAFQDTTGTNELTISGSNPVQLTYPVTLQANSATSASASLYYKTYIVRTTFDCSNIVEYGTNNVSLLDHVTLANGEVYSFGYEGTPGANDGAITGRLASLTLPTGGTISYLHYGGTNGIVCSDGTTPGLNRTTTDGTRLYQRGGTASPTAYTTMVQDEKGNQTLYHFSVDSNGNYEATHRRVYQGAVGGTPLQEAVICYNGSSGTCDGQTITPPITEADTTTRYNGGSQDVLKNSYDAHGELLSSGVYSGPTLLVQTANTYNNGQILSTKTTDTSGNTVASSTYGYDETTPTTISGLPQHTSVTGPRGNQTSSHVMTAPGSTLDTTTTYNEAGQVQSTTNPNGVTTYSYDGGTNTFLTQTTLPTPTSGVTLSTFSSYDVSSGAVLSSTGLNAGQMTTIIQLDSLLRVVAAHDPQSGSGTTISYSPNQISSSSKMDAAKSTNQVTVLDGYGRTTRTAVANGSGYYVIDTCYGPTGTVRAVGTPYFSTSLSPTSNCTSGTQYSYDALGRMTQVLRADTSSTAWTYSSRAVQQAESSGKTTIMQMDLIGRITGVCEVSSTTLVGSGSPGPCGMDIGGNGYLTSYAYDLPNHKTTITQGQQTRIFQTDAAGRSIYTLEPERSATTYSYAYNSIGLALTRTRPRANQTNPAMTTQTVTQADAVGRVVSISYNDGLTPTKSFSYDQSAPCCTLPSMGSSKGQLTTFANGVHSRSYAYDIMGRPSQLVECLPDQCGQPSYYVWRSFTYDNLGNLTNDQYMTQGGNQGPANLTYVYNSAGQQITLGGAQNDSSGAPLVFQASGMTPFGSTTVQYGNGLSTAKQFDASGQVSGTWLCSGSSQPGCAGGSQLYGTTRHTVAGQLMSSNDTATIRNSNFGSDEFGRLLSVAPADGGNNLRMNFSYDRYGNLWAENNTNGSYGIRSASWNINTTNNQMTAYSYDAAGNRLNDVSHSYQYDAEGNMISVDGGSTATFVYDALNERVKVTANGVTERYGFDLSGRRSTTWLDGTNTLKLAQYYAGSQQVAYWLRSDGHIHFEQGDGIGTERYRSTNTGGADGYYNDLPFGDFLGWPGNNTNTFHFAQLDHDLNASSGIEHATFREYSANEGRWFSPDPYDGNYDASNPQSLNRYTYVLNNPLGLSDSNGMDPCLESQGCYTVTADPYAVNWWNFEYGTYWGLLIGNFYNNPYPVDSSTGGTPALPQPASPKKSTAPSKVPANPCAYAGRAPDPSVYAQKGQAGSSNAFKDIYNLLQFRRGAALDAQVRYGGAPSYANYTFGVYMAAAGYTLNQTLAVADIYAQYRGSYPVGTPMSGPNYPFTPQSNVANITNGFNAQTTGTTCHVGG